MNVPFLDLKSQYQSISEEIETAIRHVLNATAFSGGPFVERFEDQFAAFSQCRHAIGVGSGTEAIWLALMALGIGRGDEVITVPNTFIATVEAISLCGATPVFVDVDERSYTMDPAQLERAITPRTKAIIPVHLYGQMADMDPIMAIANTHGLYVIEDACQAHGAEYRGRRAGSIGNAGCFSFYPGKNLGAYGEAGGVVTHDDELAAKIKMLRDHGQSKKYSHAMIGVNSRMDGLQGAVLGVKLKYLDSWNDGRARNAGLYRRHLAGVDSVVLPEKLDYARHIYHIFAVRVQNREAFMDALKEQGIASGIHYPVPVHLQGAYKFMGKKRGSFPVAEKCADETVSLPMFPELKEEQIEHTADVIKKFIRRSPGGR
ncbi:DegT/DnrJ/EryC1/StrS family aminotransferase [Geotalea sp. SG265]|uniref:DegT/DnrJ/EryC1/StrS family aminotransferase n=1 Tax=Geotalea sp. SG265 TaxID=2922867 RepID=UPI001FAFD9FE|nr:DegT/DnrJ/EryC1/StrS family aminotransferase [Geotalea sp. SG265]